MQASASPGKFPLPWAVNGTRNTIPTVSQIGITNGAPSLNDGFPPLTWTPIVAGGVAPKGQDFNGIFYAITAMLQWQSAGGFFSYDTTFATAIGGYPGGAVVQSADGTGWWRSTVDGNATNPDAGGAGWVPHFFYGTTAVTLTGGSVALTAVQAARPLILLSGTLTAAVNLIFPSDLVGQWVVINNTIGDFAITAKSSATGDSVVIWQSSSVAIQSDGENVYCTTPTVMTGATAAVAGTAGLVPAPTAGAIADGLRRDGTFGPVTPLPTAVMAGATSTAAGTTGLAPAPAAGQQDDFLRGDGTWQPAASPSVMAGATTAAPGAAGLAPAPAAGQQNKPLRGGAGYQPLPVTVTAATVATTTIADGGDYLCDLSGGSFTLPLPACVPGSWLRISVVNGTINTLTLNLGAATIVGAAGSATGTLTMDLDGFDLDGIAANTWRIH